MNHNTDTVLSSWVQHNFGPQLPLAPQHQGSTTLTSRTPSCCLQSGRSTGPSFSWVEAGLQKAMQVAGVITGHIQLGFESYRAGVGRVCPHCFQGWGSPSQVTKVFRDQAISRPHHSPIHRLGTGQSKQIRGITF